MGTHTHTHTHRRVRANGPMENRRAMKHTRRAHRHILRAADANDVSLLRTEMNKLYDPNSTPLQTLTTGPSKLCLVPVVDAAIMSAYKGRSRTHAELLDNVHSVGKTFGVTSDDYANILEATKMARLCADGHNSAVRQK